jgi:hypothetical protein
MIWVYIAVAVFLSWIVCDKHLPWYHYIWMLLPIDMYGLEVAGSIIKPYMIYGFAIIVYSIVKNRRIKFPLAVLIIAVLLLLSDFINGLIVGSIKQHLMFLMIMCIAVEYLMLQKKTVDLEDISKITIATTIGYGTVFAVIGFLFSRNIVLPEVFTPDRYLPGIIFSSMAGFDNFSIRLRGFNIDPNGVVTTLIPGATFALANVLYRKESKVNSIKSWGAVALFFIVVAYTGSRMALLANMIMVAIMFFIGYKQTEHKAQWVFLGLTGTLALMLFMIINKNQFFIELYDSMEAFFSSRASLTDDAGRWTIWKHNFNYLLESDHLFVGVGQNQIVQLTRIGKECHNTWLEWICGTGLIIGMVMNVFFIFAPVPFSKNAKKSKLVYEHDALPIILAYIVVLIAITSIDNVTNSVLLMLAVLFRYGKPFRKSLESGKELVDSSQDSSLLSAENGEK